MCVNLAADLLGPPSFPRLSRLVVDSLTKCLVCSAH